MVNRAPNNMTGLLDQEDFENFDEMFQIIDDKSSESNTCRRSTEARQNTNDIHLIDKRNARERKRVENVNDAFKRLRSHIPYENKKKRLSKVKTLQTAMRYINYLAEKLHTSSYVNTNSMTSVNQNQIMTSLPVASSTDQHFYRVSSCGLDTGYVVSGTLCNVSIGLILVI